MEGRVNSGARILAGRLLNIVANNAGQPVNGFVPEGWIPFRFVVGLHGEAVNVDVGFQGWDEQAPPRVARLFREQFQAASLTYDVRPPKAEGSA